MPKAKARSRARELLERVGLTQAFGDRYPWQLSGGQQQRVGVARALASDPKFMLMDEPFSAVDPVVRSQLQDEFLRLQREIGKTIIMVTHGSPSSRIEPEVGVMRRLTMRSEVVFPQPDGPTKTVSLPFAASYDRSFTAIAAPA